MKAHEDPAVHAEAEAADSKKRCASPGVQMGVSDGTMELQEI